MNVPTVAQSAPRWIVPAMRELRAPPSHPLPAAGEIALNLNECPLPPSPRAVAAAVAAIAGSNRYPATDGGSLIPALAARTGVAADRIGLAVGSDMLLHLLCMIALTPG